MPIYIYENPKTGERKEVVQRMTEPHEYSEQGIKWDRVFERPQAAIDTLSAIDPFNKRQFMERTGKLRNVKLGDLWNISKALSEKREKKAGRDEIKVKTMEQYKYRTGKPHPHENT